MTALLTAQVVFLTEHGQTYIYTVSKDASKILIHAMVTAANVGNNIMCIRNFPRKIYNPCHYYKLHLVQTVYYTGKH